MVAFILIANILLLNIVIAVFSSTYKSVMDNAISNWKYERYAWVRRTSIENVFRKTFPDDRNCNAKLFACPNNKSGWNVVRSG